MTTPFTPATAKQVAFAKRLANYDFMNPRMRALALGGKCSKSEISAVISCMLKWLDNVASDLTYDEYEQFDIEVDALCDRIEKAIETRQ